MIEWSKKETGDTYFEMNGSVVDGKISIRNLSELSPDYYEFDTLGDLVRKEF